MRAKKYYSEDTRLQPVPAQTRPVLSDEAKSILRLSVNLLRVPSSVLAEILDTREYLRHSNQQFAFDALRESDQDRAN
jgi:hypothetical protein